MTPMMKETLLALYTLNKKSQAFKQVEDVARQRLRARGWGERENRKQGSYFGMYVTSTRKLLEELSRRGYVDQAERQVPGEMGTNPYKITKKGRQKAKELS